MVADWVEDVRQQGHKAALKALYTSAEKYLEVWEQTLNRPDRSTTPLHAAEDASRIPDPSCHYNNPPNCPP